MFWSRRLLADRQGEAEGGAAIGIAFRPQLAAMRLDDRAADRESNPHPLRLRADEGLKQRRHDGIGETASGVGDAHLDERFRRKLYADGQQTPLGLGHRLDAVANEVHQDLLDLHPVDIGQRSLRRELERGLDALLSGADEGERAGFLDDLIDRLRSPLGVALLGELAEMLDDIAGTVRLRCRLFEIFDRLRGVLQFDPAAAGLDIIGDRGERLIELVGERRAHLPKLGHARYVDELGLELLEATLRFLPLGEIADESGEDAFSFDARFADCELDRKIRSVLAPASDHAPDADDPLLACPQVALEIPVVLIAIRNRHQDADVPTDELGLAVAKEPLGRRIEGSDAATLVDNDEGVGRRIDDRAQARLARSQLALGALQLRDVAGDLRCPDDPSARIADRRNGDEDIDLRAVLATPHRLVMIDALSARDLGDDLVLFAHPVGRKEDG